MPRLAKIALVLLIVLLAAGALAYRTLTAREAVPDVSDFAIDLSELRRQSKLMEGDAPLEVRSALLAETTLPRGAVFAGINNSRVRTVPATASHAAPTSAAGTSSPARRRASSSALSALIFVSRDRSATRLCTVTSAALAFTSLCRR